MCFHIESLFLEGKLDKASVATANMNKKIRSKWAQQTNRAEMRRSLRVWTTDECTKRIDRQTDESNDGESNSSASGVKAFPYEPGFKILGCQKNSHTWHNVRNRPNAFNCNSASFSKFYICKSFSLLLNKHNTVYKQKGHVNKSTNWLLIQEKEKIENVIQTKEI